MLQVPNSPIPCISISFAPQEISLEEPKSPFTVNLPCEPESPRPQHLNPPPVLAPNQTICKERRSQLSPLSPPPLGGGKGVERERFEAMLRASKERSLKVGAKKPVELRKEIAVKVQKAKLFERRAIFLSKLAAPPSPSAAELPVTPPDSPAIFHFSLPSPGLESPLEVFENIFEHPELREKSMRIEQVDFRMPHQKRLEAVHQRHFIVLGNTRSRSLPSLEQISQRLSGNPVMVSTNHVPSREQGRPTPPPSRLPSFLRNFAPTPGQIPLDTAPVKDQIPKHARVSVLKLNLRDVNKPESLTVRTPTPTVEVFPPSPVSPSTQLQIKTTICPPTPLRMSPTKFTEGNVLQFSSIEGHAPKLTVSPRTPQKPEVIPGTRAQVAKDMFNKLSRRTPGLPGALACGIKAKDDLSLSSCTEVEDKLRRRTSAPAELSTVRRGVRHPILAKRGAF